jgi:hypothetical protein
MDVDGSCYDSRRRAHGGLLGVCRRAEEEAREGRVNAVPPCDEADTNPGARPGFLFWTRCAWPLWSLGQSGAVESKGCADPPQRHMSQ